MSRAIRVRQSARLRCAQRTCTAGAALAAAIAGTSTIARAGVTSFDNLPDSQLASYAGFAWSNVGVANGAATGAGAAAGVVSPANIAYNAFAFSPGSPVAEFSSANNATFDLNSLYLTAVWRDNLQVTVDGYNGVTLVASQTVSPSAVAPTLFPLNYQGVTRVTLSASGGSQHPGYATGFYTVALDNLSTSRTFNWETPTSGSWGDGAQWDLTVAPSFDDDAVFDLGAATSYGVSVTTASAIRHLRAQSGTVTLNLNGNALSASTIGVGQAAIENVSLTLQNGVISSSSASILPPPGISANLTVGTGAAWTNSGTLTVGGTLTFAGGTVASAIDLAGGKISSSTGASIDSSLVASGGVLESVAGLMDITAGFTTSAGAQVLKSGAGTVRLSGAQNHGPGAQLTVADGVLDLQSDAGGNLALTANSTTILAVSQHLQTIHVGNGATATLEASGGKVIVAENVSASDGGRLDLKDNKLISPSAVGAWTVTGYTGITELVASGRNGGGWDGEGIITSMPQAVTQHVTTLGVATASQVTGISRGATTVWAGETVSGSDALVMYTYGGDANLSGYVDADDYFQINSHFDDPAANLSFFNGDFNYDGAITSDDFFIIDASFAAQGGPLGVAMLSQGVTPVPEPATSLVAAALAVSYGMRRVRREEFIRDRCLNYTR